MIQLADYVDEQLVMFLDAATKEDVITSLVNLVAEKKGLPESDRFYRAIVDRENLVSTAIGLGVAIPHAKLSVYKDFFVAIAILHKGIDWNAIDDSLVRLVFLIGGPENRQTDYLKILSSLTISMRDERLRRRLVTAVSPQSVIALLKGSSV